MPKTRIIEGKKYTLTLSGNVSGKKANAEKTAKKLREKGYSARVIKTKKVSGRSKDNKGKTMKVFKRLRYDVYYRKK